MGIGQHQGAAGIDHHPRALPPLPQAGPWIAEQIPQERVEDGGIEGLTGHRALRVDADHRWSDLAHGLGHEAVGHGRGGSGWPRAAGNGISLGRGPR